MKSMRLAAALFCAALLSAAAPDWEAIKSEPNLERRSREALEHARKQVNPLHKLYREGRGEEAKPILARIVEAVELAKDALDATGKHPRQSPKHFKRAEIETRKLIRDLEGVQRKLTSEERPDLKPALERIEEINSELLHGIMERKK